MSDDVPLDAFVMSGLTAAIVQITRAVDEFRIESRRLAGISATELRIIGLVAENPGTSPGELAAEVGLTSGAITAATNHLVELGLLRRRESPEDRRRLLLELLPDAQGPLAVRYREIEARVERAVEGLADDDRARIIDILSEIAAGIRAPSAAEVESVSSVRR